MAALKRSHVRTLVRLYREDVEGAAEQLDDFILHHADELTALIAVPGADVAVLGGNDHRVELFARWVEEANRFHARRRAGDDRRHAEQLARELIVGAGYGAELVLDPARLAALAACRSFDFLSFDYDTPHGFERLRLRAILRALDDTEVTHAVLWPIKLHLAYVTSHGRGRFDLAYQPLPRRGEVLFVPAFEPVRMQAAEEVVPLHPEHELVAQAVEPSSIVVERDEPPKVPHTDSIVPPARTARARGSGLLGRFLMLASEAFQ